MYVGNVSPEVKTPCVVEVGHVTLKYRPICQVACYIPRSTETDELCVQVTSLTERRAFDWSNQTRACSLRV